MKRKEQTHLSLVGSGSAGGIVPPVPSHDHEITREEAGRLKEIIWPTFNLLAQLKLRLEKSEREYPNFLPAVSEAHEGLHALNVFLHYEYFGGGAKPLR